jgi:hypothetical protein
MKPLHITVGVAAQGEVGLLNELRLVKAAILYGDRVSLCSLNSPVLLSAIGLTDLDFNRQLDFMLAVAPSIAPDRDRAELESMVHKYWSFTRRGRRTGDELRVCMELGQALNGRWRKIQQQVFSQADQAELSELRCAVESGLLEILPFKQLDDPDAVVGEFVAAICDSINSVGVYPLLDEQVGRIVQAAVEEELIEASASNKQRAQFVGLASSLINQLPLFDHATVSETIGIRNELSAPLDRFRSAMTDLAEQVENEARDGFSELFGQVILHQYLEPAVLEIKREYESAESLRTLAQRPPRRPRSLARAAVLGILASTAESLSRETGKAIGVATGAGIVTHDAYEDWREEQQGMQSNRLVFYHRTEKPQARHGRDQSRREPARRREPPRRRDQGAKPKPYS